MAVNVAGLPLKVTPFAPVKLYPVMVTPVPTVPLVGEKQWISGLMVKLAALVAAPIVLVTRMCEESLSQRQQSSPTVHRAASSRTTLI